MADDDAGPASGDAPEAPGAGERNGRGLVEALCKIIQRQSRELASLKGADDGDQGEPGQLPSGALPAPFTQQSDEDSGWTSPDPEVPQTFANGLEARPHAHVRAARFPPQLKAPRALPAQALTAAVAGVSKAEGFTDDDLYMDWAMDHDLDASPVGKKRQAPESSARAGQPGGRGRYQRASVVLRCHHCGATESPKWRYGMTLCNACGLRKTKAISSGREFTSSRRVRASRPTAASTLPATRGGSPLHAFSTCIGPRTSPAPTPHLPHTSPAPPLLPPRRRVAPRRSSSSAAARRPRSCRRWRRRRRRR